jgi:uncharacterized protein DUF1592/uncharacterized protein DUF1588/uncharacterized protein DUF1587/uncharacterized protein DUF1585/uncharacterized protein DUF1595/cytochrome c
MNRRLIFIAVLTLVPGFAWFALRAPQNVGADERKPRALLSTREFLEANCFACHDSKAKKGNLDLSTLKLEPGDAGNYALWVKVHDRVRDREMPPKQMPQPDDESRASFLKQIAQPLIEVDQARTRREGRSTWRRMNRYEYESTLRDLLGAPWLQVKEILPEDGEAFRFNKVGDALDVSHVQMSRYLSAAEEALRQVMAPETAEPVYKTERYYAREQPAFVSKVAFSQFNTAPERAVFPMIGNEADLSVMKLKKGDPMTVGAADPDKREQEGMGLVASSYEPIEIRFNKFKAPASGLYKLRIKAHSFWSAPMSEEKWWKPSREKLSAGRTDEPIVLYAEIPPRTVRRIGAFTVKPEAGVYEVEAYLLKGETIRPDAVRFFRSRPPGSWHNPLAEKDGQPGVAFRWMEADGPIKEEFSGKGRRLMFGDLPCNDKAKGGPQIVSKNPHADAERLLRNFVQKAYRRPTVDSDIQEFVKLADTAIKSGANFTDAMITAYSAVLCSPAFITMEEKPGTLDDYALASRLSYFLWNSEPDQTLQDLAKRGALKKTSTLRAQTERMLNDDKSRRFTEAFLDYWLDLRKINNTSPDAVLYSDYVLDDYLIESVVAETRTFFQELVRGNLPSRNLVASDFVIVNDRLGALYGLPGVKGVEFRKVQLPSDSVRGGLLTQASVLKVTANGTTTSPVLRGAWIMERILGKPAPPPPPGIPSVEPDIRGATTIREQLEKHRSQKSCNVCHAKIDPAGFALENFDVLGGWRDRYRALGDGNKVPGYAKSGQPFEFHLTQPVDASGTLPGGGRFQDVRELKRLILQDERQIARNLVNQLIIYSTGAPVRFGDRPIVEGILDRAAASSYGIKSLIEAIIESELFRNK